MSSSKQQYLLTSELWTEVFAHVETAQMGYRTWNDIQDDQQNQRQMHQLRLVCKQFNEVFAAQPLFLKRLSLPLAFPKSSLPSLLAWLQQSKDCLEILEANCASPEVDVVLDALTSVTSQLKLINLCEVNITRSVRLLGSFSNLEMCNLWAVNWVVISLYPLQALPKLRSLGLMGKFDGLASLEHLTHLQCFTGVLDCTGSCEFARSLQQLDLKHTTLQNFDISICQGLQVLQLDSCSGREIDHHSYLSEPREFSLPVGLSLLTNLETLSLASFVDPLGDDHISLDWASELKTLSTLQDLSIKSFYVNSWLIKSVSCLSCLTRLVVIGPDHQHFSDSPWLVLDLDFNWCSLKSLKHLFLSHSKLEVGPGTASLLLLQHLTDVTLHYVIPETVVSVEHYVALIHSLITLRPHVRLDFQTTAIDHFLDYGKHGAIT